MLRFLAAIAALMMFAAPASAQVTQWRVRSAEGLDALLLIGAAGGDTMQQSIYPDEIAWVRAHVSPEGLAAVQAIDHALRGSGKLTGPTLVDAFSVGPFDSIDDVIASAAEPDHFLRPGLASAPDWDEAEYTQARPVIAQVAVALRALKAAGFSQWRQEHEGAHLTEGIAAVEAAVAHQDIIAEDQRFLARHLDPTIDILVVAYCKPYGIRIHGQRFITHYSWPAGVQIRTAAHEIFHPPYDLNDWRILARLTALEHDPWMVSIVETHDPRFGYNSFEGVVNEGTTQALDQIVSERLGFARDSGQRWRDADGGMHMFAAALYQAMKEDRYDQRGGSFDAWFTSALDRRLLTPAEVRRRAALIVGAAAVAKWNTRQPAPTTH